MISRPSLIWHDADCAFALQCKDKQGDWQPCNCGASRWNKLMDRAEAINKVLAEFGTIENFHQQLSTMRRYDSKSDTVEL